MDIMGKNKVMQQRSYEIVALLIKCKGGLHYCSLVSTASNQNANLRPFYILSLTWAENTSASVIISLKIKDITYTRSIHIQCLVLMSKERQLVSVFPQ